MQRARMISGLTKNRNSGGGDKKQGLPATVGVNHFALNLIKRQTGYCKCQPTPPLPSYVYSFVQPDNIVQNQAFNQDDSVFVTLSPNPNEYVLLIQYTQEGRANWSAGMVGNGQVVNIGDVTTDAYNVYVSVISESGNLTIFNKNGSLFRTVMTSGPTEFVVWYDHAGNAEGVIYMKTFTSAFSKLYMKVDADRNLYIAGSIEANGSFYNQDGTLFKTIVGSARTVFLMKYRLGVGVWETHVTNNPSTLTTKLVIDPATQSICWCGAFFGSTVDFNNASGTLFQQLTCDGSTSNGFLAKYNADGTGSWVVDVGGDDTRAVGCTVTPDNSIYLAATARTSANLYEWNVGLPTVLSGFSQAVVLAKYSAGGALQWYTTLTTQNPDLCIGKGVVSDSKNSVYIYGDFSNQLVVNNRNATMFATLTKTGVGDGFMTKFDADGTAKWSVLGGIYSYNQANAAATDAGDNVYFQSMYSATTTVRNEDGTPFRTLALMGAVDTSLVKYNSDGKVVWASRTAGGTGFDYELELATLR